MFIQRGSYHPINRRTHHVRTTPQVKSTVRSRSINQPPSSLNGPAFVQHKDSSYQKAWWKEMVIYQIYPRSFCDSNGDGIGDLPGITSKLDYLKDLGVDAIWLCPIYKSPNDDNGYDISDYYKIMEEFGTEEDFKTMIEAMHSRGIKLIMDFVANHCSDEHPWFKESRKSKDNPYRDWFYWRPPSPDGNGGPNGEPNNWTSFFTGSAWELDHVTGEYYLHLFSKKQPDLNWENPKVRQALKDIMKYWLQQGVDGFRLDALNVISKIPNLPNGSQEHFPVGAEHFFNGPMMMPWMKELKRDVLSKYNTVTVAETPNMPLEMALEMIHPQNGAFNMLFHFELMGIDTSGKSRGESRSFKLKDVKHIMSRWQKDVHERGWNSLFLENHDQPRGISRFGNTGEFREPSAKMLATWLYLQQGTPFVYQGQEIGMSNVDWKDTSQIQDIQTLGQYRTEMAKPNPNPLVLKDILERSRDNGRTPMQWDSSKNAGFTSGKPWLMVNPNYVQVNVGLQVEDANSILNYYKTLLRLRKEHDVLIYGDYTLISDDDDGVYAYLRCLGNQRVLVVANFYEDEATLKIPDEFVGAKKLIGNYEREDIKENHLHLRPYETIVYLA
eukprot:TRINITY_DN17401_c0_g1_i1.p1 TRINITY_DN17401_c0_g1~~TRINITY_DN17401_c0_g1_i1.p1  ORF type:complete len:611 (+),score=170.70 TRINITY_DN17401_c0_g1_i1:6-1838(+)